MENTHREIVHLSILILNEGPKQTNTKEAEIRSGCKALQDQSTHSMERVSK